jgi:Rap1a immunity proteins
MRAILSLAAAMLVAGNAGAAELARVDFEGETVGSIVKLCTASEDTDAGKYAIGFCYGWIEGLDQFYDALLADERFNVQPVACPGTELSREESRDAFVRWAKDDPAKMKLPALEGIIRAAKETFPCS